MNLKHHKIDRIHMVMVIGMVIFLFISGCAAIPRSIGPVLDSAPLPAYEAGTTYIHSDGKWEIVTEVTPDGTYCRRYVQILESPTSYRTYYGVAYRGADGVWKVPRR